MLAIPHFPTASPIQAQPTRGVSHASVSQNRLRKEIHGRHKSAVCPPLAASFRRAHTAFELGEVSRAREILIIAALFGAFEPAVNPCEKESKHKNLHEIDHKRRSWRDAKGNFPTVLWWSLQPIVGRKYVHVYLLFFT